MKRLDMQTKGWSAALFLTLVLAAIGLSISGCKKTDKTPPAQEESVSAAKLKLKEMDLQLIADNFVSPIGLVPIPDNSGRLVVIDQTGTLWIIDGNGNKLPTPFIDLTSRMT